MKSKWGRFHDDPQTEPTTYVADSLLTAWREVAARFGEIPADPREFRAWRVRLPEIKLADLRGPEEQGRHHVTEGELFADPPPTHCKALGRTLRRAETGYQGFIYRSVRNRPDGVCMVLFLEHVGELIELEPVDAEWAQFVIDTGL